MNYRVAEYLLCPGCEDPLNKGGETWTLRNAYRGGRAFPLRDALRDAPSVCVLRQAEIIEAASLPQIQMAKLVYFAISVFWKASRAETPKTDNSALIAAAAERGYLRAFARRSYLEAMGIAEQYAAEHNDDRRLRGWFLQLAARAAHYAQDLAKADALQREAFQANPILWCPSTAGDLYVPAMQVGSQAEAIMTQIARFALPTGHLQDFEDEISNLTPAASSNQLEQALKRLGDFLGFYAERPDQDYGLGPDVLWLPSEAIGFVIESKGNKKGTSSLSKTEHGQLLVSENWFLQHYADRTSVRVVLHHNNRGTEPAMTQGTLALTFESLARLTTALRIVLQDACLSVGSSKQRLGLCDSLLRKHHLTVPEIIAEYFVPFEVDQG